MADPNKHKSVSVPILAWTKANFLQNKIVDGTNLSISKVIESLINKEAERNGYQNIDPKNNIINFIKTNIGVKI
jgi:hypothetical protein